MKTPIKTLQKIAYAILRTYRLSIHRVIGQLVAFTFFIYQFGWGAFLLLLLIFLFEIIPYGRADEWINPAYKKFRQEKQREEFFEEMGIDENLN